MLEHEGFEIGLSIDRLRHATEQRVDLGSLLGLHRGPHRFHPLQVARVAPGRVELVAQEILTRAAQLAQLVDEQIMRGTEGRPRGLRDRRRRERQALHVGHHFDTGARPDPVPAEILDVVDGVRRGDHERSAGGRRSQIEAHRVVVDDLLRNRLAGLLEIALEGRLQVTDRLGEVATAHGPEIRGRIPQTGELEIDERRHATVLEQKLRRIDLETRDLVAILRHVASQPAVDELDDRLGAILGGAEILLPAMQIRKARRLGILRLLDADLFEALRVDRVQIREQIHVVA